MRESERNGRLEKRRIEYGLNSEEMSKGEKKKPPSLGKIRLYENCAVFK